MTLTAGKTAELYTALRFNKAISLDASLTGSSATPATTGAMSVPMTSAVITITPTGNCTFNAATVGVATQQVVFLITTTGVVSRNLTFGTGFKSSGVLATGIISGKVWTVAFVSNGISWLEVSRRGPL